MNFLGIKIEKMNQSQTIELSSLGLTLLVYNSGRKGIFIINQRTHNIQLVSPHLNRIIHFAQKCTKTLIYRRFGVHMIAFLRVTHEV
jgi:hypothetical protein